MPVPVLERAREELVSRSCIGMSVMELSHLSDHFAAILTAAETGLRELLRLPEDYKVLFLQGGASLQFSLVPMNFLSGAKVADYVVSGAWGVKAVAEAQRGGTLHVIFSPEDGGFRSVPDPSALRLSAHEP